MLELSQHKQPARTNRLFKQWMLVFLLIAALGLPLIGKAQVISYSGKKVTLQQVFAEIKKQTSYAVVFNPEQVDVSQLVQVNAKSMTLDQFMKALLAGLPLNYTIVGNTIVVFKKQKSCQKNWSSSSAQRIYRE